MDIIKSCRREKLMDEDKDKDKDEDKDEDDI